MAKKTTQSVKDRLRQYRKTACRRSFFDGLPEDAKQFMLEVRALYEAGDLDLAWTELHAACKSEFPSARWPATPQSITQWVQGEM